MDLEKIFNDEYNAYSEIKHLIGGKIVNESMPCINKEKFIEVVKKLLIHDVSQAKRPVCPDCFDRGELRNDKEEIIGTCPCHY